MASAEFNNDEIKFISASSSSGSITYDGSNDEFGFNRPTTFFQGLSATSVTVSGSGSISTTSEYGDIQVSSLSIKNASNGYIAIDVPDSVTDHTLKLPSAQGSKNSSICNDGSGNLTWVVGPRLEWAIQGALLDYSFGDKTIEFTSLQSATGSYAITKYEFNSYSWRSSNTFTVPSGQTGWYRIQLHLYHPTSNMSGTSSQSGLGEFKVGIKFSSVTNATLGIWDNNSGRPEISEIDITRYLSAGNSFEFVMESASNSNEDCQIHASIMRLA